MASTSGASSSLPKWQLALVVGAPVALGLGYMYYKNSINKPEEKPGKGRKSAKGNDEKQISIDGDFPAKTGNATTIETPLDKAKKYKTEGNGFFNQGKYDEAIAQYNLAIESCPKENTEELATYYQNRAAAYEKLKKFNAVRADCTKALELKPIYVKAMIRRARAMESCNELETALEDITAACILESFSNQNTLYIADKVLKQLGKQHAQEHMASKKAIMPSKYFISTYFLAFHNDPLLAKMQRVEEQNDSSFKQALLALKQQDYDNVIPFCTEELNSLAPDDNSLHKIEVVLLRGTFYLLLGQHENAANDLSAVINSDIASKELKVNALIKRASMFIQLENASQSFDDFENAVSLAPDCGDIYHNRGQVHLLMEKLDEAKSDFKKAVELNPGFGVAYVQKCYADYRYAVAQKDMNLMNTAMTNFNKAFEKFPDCSECYTLYAQMLIDTQDFAKADAYFVKASKRDPKNATILVYRGLLQLQWHNDIEKAVEYIRKAIELDDKCEFAYETLGTIEVQRANLKDAISLFDKALALGRTLMELTHIFSLRDAAKAQLVVTERLGGNLMKTMQEG
ncbi:mitochondrial import receptor subunit TOM70-like [Phymastichus coffea]|uniref:mitochondrial import receptor subunit TOM70-like n=1 Tax=Phymastichus coffea TaxID=108790 RepID=UPI00273BA926|nr:mitochondrial import receptor subunit TOM70-like [Phymastichus coffea]XP_058809591.1 mitochondrial import receptor subunit TOM70-like [Phymastichus coffea]